MIENRVESFDELKSALSNLSTISQDICSSLRESQVIYEEQNQAWSSVNSTHESEKMVDYAEAAKKIPENMQKVSEALDRTISLTKEIDAE